MRDADVRAAAVVRRGWLGGILAAVALIVGSATAAAQADVAAGSGWGGATTVRPAAPSKPATTPSRRVEGQDKPGEPRQLRGKTTSRRSGGGGGQRNAGSNNVVFGVAISGDDTTTRVSADLAGPVEAVASSIGDPPRVIIDLPETEFRIDAANEVRPNGLVTGVRYGVFEAGRSRVVLDTRVPVKVRKSNVLLEESSGAFRLEIELVPTTASELRAIEIAEAVHTLKPALDETAKHGPSGPPGAPVIVIDAGHGGIDSGASGQKIKEKDLVLAVAQQIERSLRATGAYDVVMTRARDVFVSLDRRVEISRQHDAALFISVHADSLDGREAGQVRGATVYTLAEQATDDAARRIADKENAVDLLAGLSAASLEDNEVRDFLVDLMRRESHGFADAFREELVAELKTRIVLSHAPMRSAPFKVLRQPAAPAVLVELGYISNAEDEATMLKPEWQAGIAAAVTRAVTEHFRQRTATKR
ncbi:MAG: N-acetylmuramoyl-L-alanine amidase [Proteobacteria bacterium]|nr:N-acetylmuramoyl-L-alanine amidase [Pseudomonadota bacterium]